MKPYSCGQKMFDYPNNFGFFLKKWWRIKKPAYCTDSPLGGPFFSSHHALYVHQHTILKNFENHQLSKQPEVV